MASATAGQPFDRLGATRRLWNCHVNHGPGGDISIPLLLSHLGYGLFFDNPRLASVDAGKSHDRICLDYETDAGAFDLYYLGGDDLRDVLLTSCRSARPRAACRRAGRSATCSPRGISKARRRFAVSPGHCARRSSPAMR